MIRKVLGKFGNRTFKNDTKERRQITFVACKKYMRLYRYLNCGRF